MAANKKISQLTELTTVETTDVLAVVDLSANQTKKVTKANLLKEVEADIAVIEADITDLQSQIDTIEFPVASVNGQTGVVVLTTAHITEGANLYYTQARFDTAFAAKSTTNLAEGTNLYYTDERVDDRVAALIQNGTGITWTYSDALGTLTPAVSITQYTDELAQDATASLFAAGTHTAITVTYNDAAGSISLALVTTGDWTGTFDGIQGTAYLARANHTGTQLSSTISDFAEAVDDRLGAMLAGTANQIVATYDDTAGTLTLSTPQNIHTGASPTFVGATLSGNVAHTIANAANVDAYTIIQNDTTNNKRGLSVTNAGTGNAIFVDANGDTGTLASSSGAILLENTGNAGFGLNLYSNHATYAQSLAFMKLDHAGATGNVLRIDNDGTGHAIQVTASGATAVSTSTGGAILLTNTGNNGSGLVIYSNNGTPTSGAALLAVRADNAAYTENVVQVSNDGTGYGLSINATGGTGGGITVSAAGDSHTLASSYTGTGASQAAGSIVSTNPNFSAFQVTGSEIGHGTIKVSHVKPVGSADGNAAAISIDLQDTGAEQTAAQGIYLTTTTGGTTGALMQLRNNMLALGGADLVVGIMLLSAGGNLGLGTPTAATPIEKLTLGTGGLNKPIFALAETTAPSATAGYGKVYVKSSDGLLYYMDDAGTEFDLTSTGALTWSEVTGTTQAAVVNKGYIANNASRVTVTLPTTAPVGSRVRVAGKGAGGWRIAQNASELIYFGDQVTTTGTGGRLDSNDTHDAVELICIVADTEWMVVSSVGNITIV